MQIELINRPGNTAAKVVLQPGETCTAESGAMIAMSGNMDITTTTHKKGNRGIMKAIKRMVAGESLFLNHFEPKEGSGEVWLGTSLAGDMEVMELDQDSLIVQGSSFLACEHDVNIDLGIPILLHSSIKKVTFFISFMLWVSTEAIYSAG